MRTTSTECRCKSCGALLAKRDHDGVSIRRGELQTTITGDFTVSVTCYRCRTLNVVTWRPSTPPPAAAAAHRRAA